MGLYPLLVVDLWEHAYYLKHQNKRKQYLEEWWRVVCWREVVMLQRYWRALRGEELSQAHTEL
jgi:Fe-Mn family superoxide dismutase